jgi:hypothetical protein
LVAESGEYPIPFADRINRLCEFARDGHAAHPDNKLYAAGRLSAEEKKQ